MQTTTTTAVVSAQECSQRQSSFVAGHTNSGPINAEQRRISEASSYPSQYMQQSGGIQYQQSGQYQQQSGGQYQQEEMYNGMQVIGERVLEHEMIVPTRRVVEEIVEKIVVVPEKRQREEICEERRLIRERIVHVAKPVEKVVYEDVVEVVSVDKVVSKPTPIQQEVVVYKDVYSTVEVERPYTTYQDREVVKEYEVTEFKDVPQYRTVEVPETRVMEKVVEKPVPRYIEVEIPDYKEVEVTQDIHRAVPQPLEVVTDQTFKLPLLVPEYEEVPVPIFVPSFTEVPLPAEYLTEQSTLQIHNLRQRLAMTTSNAMPSLCAIEELGRDLRSFQPQNLTDPELLTQRIANKIND